MHSFYSALMGGVLTGLGGAAFLGADDRAIGAFLFSFGMFAALALGLPQYPGRCGRAVCGGQFKPLGVILIGNIIGAALTGVLFGLVITSKAVSLQAVKLAQSFPATLLRGMFCGMILFTAAEGWRRLEGGKAVGVLLGVPAFILAGFENSMADTFYFGAALGQSGVFDPQSLLFLLAAILGNTLGASLLCLSLPGEEWKAPEKAKGAETSAPSGR